MAHTKQGNLFGVICKGHEKRLRGHPAWQIEWATATDGNVHAILRPTAAQVGQLAMSLPQGAISPAALPRSRVTGAQRGVKQLELPFEVNAASKVKPMQLELFAKAA